MKSYFSFFFFGILVLPLILTSSIAYGSENSVAHRAYLPKWELGLGVFALRLHDYRGSDQSHNYYWPIPYLIYRGKVVEVENSMVKGSLIDTGRFRMGLSLMGSLRVDSKKNTARLGMPALDPTFEVGPGAAYDFYVSDSGKSYSTIGGALRSAYAAEFFYAHHIGYFAVPYISHSFAPQEYTLGHYLEFSWALMLADQKYHSYFYDVDAKYATASRHEYKSKGGFSGWHTLFYFSKKIPPLYYFGFLRYDRLDKAAFADSPLVRKKDYVAMGFGFIWYFLQSKELSEIKHFEK